MAQHKSNNGNSDVSALNQSLVDELKNKGHIHTSHVETAFRAVLRHLFVPGVPLDEVYSDRSILTKKDRDGQPLSSSSQPAIMAIMLEQLGLKPGQKALEIGAGTGYNAALMAHIVGEIGQVVTIDIDEDTAQGAREHLAAAGFDRVQVVCADGGYGYPNTAPYDRIILTVAASDITPAWTEQLKPGGRLVLPLALTERIQQSIAFEQADDHLVSISVKPCGFIWLRGAFAVVPMNQVQLGPDPGLVIDSDKEHPVDAEKIYGWLVGTSKDWETGVEIKSQEIFALGMWLALRGPEMHVLVARGDAADRDIIPLLIQYGGKRKFVVTSALIGDKGLAALMRPTRQSRQPADVSEPFTLSIRQFGPDPSLAQRLLECIRAWDDTGRPSSKGLRVRAYPKDTNYGLAENDFVIEKQWTRLVLDWTMIQ